MFTCIYVGMGVHLWVCIHVHKRVDMKCSQVSLLWCTNIDTASLTPVGNSGSIVPAMKLQKTGKSNLYIFSVLTQ